MVATLYLTRNGLLEPLGQSQVMAYLRGLSADYRITLITFEKPDDLADAAAMQQAREDCGRYGIRWLPQRYRYRPRFLAPAWGMLALLWLCLRVVRRERIQLIHARSYLPAFVALVASRTTGVPFIFDMRALWPEELITAGRLRRGSLLHRAIVAGERACLRRAGAVVSLTEAAVVHLRRVYPNQLKGRSIAVIPTCADLARFTPAEEAPPNRILGCLGTLTSGWFRMDWLVAFLAAAARRDPDMQFELTTRDDPVAVRSAFAGQSDVPERLSLQSARPEQIPDILRRQMASVMFYAGGEVSELGRSPTRMGEILGCGIPVVANDGVGDVGHIIRSYRVGVLAKGPAPGQMEEAFEELRTLLLDPELRQRCRRAAEEVFSLDVGTQRYRDLYAAALGRP